MKTTAKKAKPKFLFCILSMVVIIIGYFIFLICIGRSYTLYFFLEGKPDQDNIRVTFSSDDIVKVTGIHTETFSDTFRLDMLAVDVESIRPGDVTVYVDYQDIYTTEPIEAEDAADNIPVPRKIIVENKHQTLYFHVTPFGLIYDISNDSFSGFWTIPLLVNALLTVLLITAVLAFMERMRKGAFTYSMVLLGAAVFFLAVTIVFSVKDTLYGWEFHWMVSVNSIILSLQSLGSVFVRLTVIPLLLFCLALCISNIQLVRHEGFRPQNLLGFLLGLAVIIGVVLIHLSGINYYKYTETERNLLIIINTAFVFTFTYLECLLGSTVFCAIAATKYKICQPMDYIIILGCAIRKDGTPTPILRGRIERAIAFDREQQQKWHRQAVFVPSGGQGQNEVISEAECIKRFLMEQGIPEERILKEDQSVNTYQNMAFSKKVIENDAGCPNDKKIAFSTTNYHVFRGYTLARRVGMKVKGLSAKTRLYFFPNAFLREFIGLLWEKKLLHLMALVIGTLFFAVLYFIVLY